MSYKRVAATMWGITTINETWGYEHSTIMSDTHVVCDWDNVPKLADGKESLQRCDKKLFSAFHPSQKLNHADGLRTARRQ